MREKDDVSSRTVPPLKCPVAVSWLLCCCACLTGGFQCLSVVVVERGADVGSHRGAVGKAKR